MSERDNGPGALTAFAFYVALVLAATWPLLLESSTHCWGIRYDLWGNLWLMGYFHNALKSGVVKLNTLQVFFPEGFSVWAYGHFVLQLITSPLLSLVSPSTAYAILVWLAVSGSALSLYLLAFDQVGSRWAAFVAGALYAFHGLTYAELAVGSVEQAATFGLPIFLLCLIRWHERGGWKWGLASYVSIMLTAMCNWFFGIALAALTVLYVAFHLVSRHQGTFRIDWSLLAKALLLAAVCRLSVEPFFARVVPEILARPTMSMAALQAADTSGEEDDVPPLLSHVNTDAVDRSALRQTVQDSLPLSRVLSEDLTTLPRLAGPGFCIVLLSVVGVVLGGGRARFWLFAFVVLTLVSMGPLLKTDETSPASSVILPYYPIYNAVPIFRVAYRPYRFQSAALLAGCVLAACGLCAVLRRTRRGMRPVIAVGIVATVFFIRWVLCTPERVPLMSDARVPPFYTDIASEPDDFAIVEIPLHHWAFGSSNARFQYYESVHRKSMLNNSMFINMQQLLRLRDLATRHAAVMTLAEGQYARRVEPPEGLADDLKWLRDQGFRYVVVHTTFPRDTFHPTGHNEPKEMISESFIDFLTGVFGPPRETADALLFDVRTPKEVKPSAPAATLEFADDYERIQRPLALEPGLPLTWKLGDDGRNVRRIAFWAMAEPGTKSVDVKLSMLDADGKASEATVNVALSDLQWGRFTITPQSIGLERFPPLTVISIEANKTRAEVNLSHPQLLY